MDLPRLLNDIPKYKPWVSDANWVHWEEFMKEASNLETPKYNTWELHTLVSAAIKSSRVQPSVPISKELQTILEKESAVPPKVITLTHH